ncbi:MAG: hypothetical protein ACRCYQ_00890 [Nocardioides sp.]
MASLALLAGTMPGTSADPGTVPVVADPGSSVATTALGADDFVQSMGSNTHYYYLTHTFADGSTMVDKVKELGLRNIREGIDLPVFADPKLREAMDELAASGVKFSLITDFSRHTPEEVRDWVKDFGPENVASVENRNEPDLFDRQDGTWPIAKVHDYQRSLWSVMKADPATAEIEILGSPVTSVEAAEQHGSVVADSMDRANIHNYLSTREPETKGWGEDGYGSLDFAVRRVAKVMKPGDVAPISTETCYQNSTDTNSLPEVVSGRYIPRQYLFSFANGIPRTYCYELWDEADDIATGEMNYGMVRHDGSTKPAYNAVAAMTKLLGDEVSADFVPGELAYSIAGETEGVQQVLLQKQDGTFYLALWLGKPSFDPVARTEQAVEDQTVTVMLPASVQTATSHALDDEGSMSEAALQLEGGEVTVSVTDKITFVELAGS